MGYSNPLDDYLEWTGGDDIKLIPKYRRYILRAFIEGACKPENTNFYQLKNIPSGMTLEKICNKIAKSYNLETAAYIASLFVLYHDDNGELTKPPLESFGELLCMLDMSGIFI